MSKTKRTKFTIETSQAVCQGCKRPLTGFEFDMIGEFTFLRCGNLMIQHVEMKCLSCGRMFYWTFPEKNIKKSTAFMEAVLQELQREKDTGEQ